ncbi:MAG: hypothetical protein H7330_09385 [Hymenobacteraceae bacterium]|nr:hypothetical protein [Hymenobacteraceae bacterium]
MRPRRTSSGPKWLPLVESVGRQRQFARWRAECVYLNWTGPWFKAYHYRRAGLPTAWPVEPLAPDGGPPRGVALLYDERIGQINFSHLFTLLRERVIALGYRVAHADQHTSPILGHPAGDTIEKYVLHPIPSPVSEEGPCNQRFGQVTVDLVRRDHQPMMLRLQAAPLPGAIFTTAPPFDELLRHVLGCDA